MAANFLDLEELDVNESYRINRLYGTLDHAVKDPIKNGVIGISSDGGIFFRQEKNVYRFEIKDEQKNKLVRDFLERGFVDIAKPKEIKDDVISLYVVFFSGIRYIGGMNLIFSNNAIESIEKIARYWDSSKIKKSLQHFLDSSFYLQNGGGVDRPVIAYTDSDEWINSYYDEKKEDAQGQAQDNQKRQSNLEQAMKQLMSKQARMSLSNVPALYKRPQKTLALYGKEVILYVGLYLDKEGKLLTIVQKAQRGRKRQLPCFALGDTSLIATTEYEYSSEAIGSSMQNDENTYVNLWKLYSQKEGDFLLKRIRQVGIIRYKDYKICIIDKMKQIVVSVEDESRFSLRLLQKGDRLRVTDSLPPYLGNENSEMGWEEYLDLVMNPEKRIKESNGDFYEITDIKGSGLTLKPLYDAKMNLTGNLILDDTGDRKQIIRRKQARDRIEKGISANPHLGQIIGGSDDTFMEDAGVLPMEWKRKKQIPALTHAVAKKIFRHEATATQREAISIALNTPDIAIIQGPPGTGKTTVITAILERLNELADKRDVKRGQVLITSLQHDAVRNVIERVSINSLPTIKFGKRQADEEDMDTLVDHWCENLAQRLEKKNPQLVDTRLIDELTDAFAIYECNPTVQNEYNYLTKALTLESTDTDLIADLQAKLTVLEQKIHTNAVNELVCNIQRLRTQKESFRDGGADVADAVLMRVEHLLNRDNQEDKNILDTLEAAADCFDADPDPTLLKQLARCKRSLLMRCIPKPHYTKACIDPEIIDLYQRQKKELASYREQKDYILNNLLKALEEDPEYIRETLKNYSFAYAATAQQSLGFEIRDAKEALGKDQSPEYDTVIIDEAARVNPGDLMIPLSQARRRIIMVGDHRQLPHMYDEEIFEELNREGNNVHAEDIRESMFEHLLNRAKALTKKDGIVRFVTLDNQYRMHPDLGNFISRNFYERYGEGFYSPLGPENFSQILENQPMKWIDIPLSSGKMESLSYSKFRSCEVECIIDEIRRYKEKMGTLPLTIGVISFYRAQVNQIRRRLKDENLSDNVSVGTVDAFQGMEFDVIFLSIVRTGIDVNSINLDELEKDPSSIENQQEREKFVSRRDLVGRRQYGFLTSENRLCVALSRQKRLLVVVGDGTLFHGNPGGRMAQLFVPALKNFYELCMDRGMVVRA